MMPLLLTLFVALAAASVSLPPKTVSGVCPAIVFSQEWVQTQRGAIIKFLPDEPRMDFKFINVHIVMETRDGRLLGKVVNYPMERDQQVAMGVWQAPMRDDEHLAALHQKRGDVVFKYSFTYCVGVQGKPVDCDTESYTFSHNFQWRAGLVQCPKQCGLEASVVSPQSVCMDPAGQEIGREYPAVNCKHLPLPGDTSCPATESCVTYEWRAMTVQCPKECGQIRSSILPEVSCMGSDGRIAADRHCATQPRPAAVNCPATKSCVTFEARESLVECPEECGLQASKIPVTLTCLGSDGQDYPLENCNQPYPEPLYCPATPACVTYHWEAMAVHCPMECGHESSSELPEAVCMGSNSMVAPAYQCAKFPRPSKVYCPATPECVSYYWKPVAVVCPTVCGMESSKLTPDAICMGTDGSLYAGSECSSIQRPAAVFCPATRSCVTYHWEAKAVHCPTECGHESSSELPKAVCMGSNSVAAPAYHCSEFPRPSKVYCPATPECVSYYWKPVAVQCPTQCGMESSKLTPDAICMGTDGSLYAGNECSSIQRPAAVFCPATRSCVTFDWKIGQFRCPSECGLKSSVQNPPVTCKGSDGLLYPDHNCKDIARPSENCPPTSPCITYTWRAKLVECPTQCGMEDSEILAPVTCVGSDGSIVTGQKCLSSMKPGPVRCPATAPCPLSPYCHPIQYHHHVKAVGATYQIVFEPVEADIRRRKLEFVDAHYWIEDGDGNMVGQKRNHRMDKPGVTAPMFEFVHLIQTPGMVYSLQSKHKLAYSFTYCVDMIDCDTAVYYYSKFN